MITEKISEIRERMEAAKARRRSDLTDDVRLVAVTKNHDAEAMREAIAAGAEIVGESRVQEAEKKYVLFRNTVEWHLVGHLQTNKAKQAVRIFDVIESVDSEKLANAINKEAEKIGKMQDILVQVNLAREQQKSGVMWKDFPSLVGVCDRLPFVRLRGLMFVAPDYENKEQCRPLFCRMREIFDDMREKDWKTASIDYLSMGMSQDFEIAIEEGSNLVRVGTSIFGPRQY